VDEPIHADLLPLAFLLGRWEGSGEGIWPPGEAFRYGEEMTFEHVGDAYLAYSQRSWSIDDEKVLHLERGFVRSGGDGLVELTLAHPLGVAEVAEGCVRDGVLDVTAAAVPRARTASPVTALRRRIEVAGDILRYELWMAMDGGPPTRHLAAELKRVDA